MTRIDSVFFTFSLITIMVIIIQWPLKLCPCAISGSVVALEYPVITGSLYQVRFTKCITHLTVTEFMWDIGSFRMTLNATSPGLLFDYKEIKACASTYLQLCRSCYLHLFKSKSTNWNTMP